MGYECGFVKMPRYKDTTWSQVGFLQDYFDWLRNFKGSMPIDAYFASYTCREVDTKLLRKTDVVDFYKTQLHQTDTGERGLIDTIEYWCSDGRVFADWFTEHCTKTVNGNTVHKELTKELMFEALEFVDKCLENQRLEEWVVVGAFKENEETGEKTIIPLDGIEIQNEKGLIKRLYATEDFVYYHEDFDMETVDTLLRLKDCLHSMIENIDFHDEMVYFFVSW